MPREHLWVRRFISVLLIGIVVVFLANLAIAETTLEKIKRTGEIVVGNSGVYPPFEFKEGGELVGFDIDLTHLIARELGVKPKFVVIDFKGIIPALKSSKVDVLITAMTYRESRAEQIAFSESYYDTATAIAVRKGRTDIQKKEDLAGKIVGVELGTTGEREARSVEGVKEIKTYDTLMLAMRDLQIGRVDAVVSTLPPLQYLMHRNYPDLEVAVTYQKGWVGINTRKEDQDLLAEINRILRKLKESGELKALHEKWFGAVIP